MVPVCLLLLSFTVLSQAQPALQCRDMSNKPVDWFVIYKLPKLKTSPDVHAQNGTAFLYLDARNIQWSYPNNISIMDSNQALAYTLEQYYLQQDNSAFLSIFYNDEHPDNNTSFDLGHQKGVLVFGPVEGFWLIHSAPKFPPPDHYFYPPNAHSFAQMAVCLSLPNHALTDVANQLYFTQPYIYQFNLPPPFADLYPRLSDVKAGLYPKTAPFYSVRAIKSLDGTLFTHFAKAQGFANDLYGALIAPFLSVSLYAETWQHEPGNLGPWCQGAFYVEDITWTHLPFNISFESWWDHSKYAIAWSRTNKAPPPYVCIGDINRQEHQMVRGGGSLCFQNKQLFDLFDNIPSKLNTCSSKQAMLKSNTVL